VSGYLKSLLIVLGLVLLSAAAVAGYATYWNYQPLPGNENRKLELTQGQSFSAFATSLAGLGLIDHPRLWSAMARLSGDARRVQAGEYWLKAGDTPQSLLDRLLRGEVIQYEVKLLEGWTVSQVLAELARHDKLGQELRGADTTTLLGALGFPEGNSEGLFFPDTYRFRKGETDADILRQAYLKLQTELEDAWQRRDAGLPYEMPYQALIAASLIEKETGRPEDRTKIAQVFVSRLQIGMRLQTDPSVIYGIGTEFDGNLTRRHLKQDTPYNTYTRKGLPPTPIALVGADSLEAALHPAGGEFLYFVSRGDGTSQFSVSLEEHQAAVRKYQLK